MPENTRTPEAPVDPLFIERWSPRAYSPEPLPEETIRTLFEAARWAPSSSNEQPWLFLYAISPEDLALFRSVLLEGNRWAHRAPFLAFVLARRLNKKGNPNRLYAFDTGAAWMSVALQARKLGLYAHAMAGFDQEKAYETLKISRDQYEIMAAIAVGKYGDPAQLPPEQQQREKPSTRKPLAEMVHQGPLL